jgi:hypothetical protein
MKTERVWSFALCHKVNRGCQKFEIRNSKSEANSKFEIFALNVLEEEGTREIPVRFSRPFGTYRYRALRTQR